MSEDRIPTDYRLATQHDKFEPSRYPLVKGQKDEVAALRAYTSLATLLDFRAAQFPNDLCLADVDLENDRLDCFTFSETRRLVISVAKALSRSLGVRQELSQKSKVVGFVAGSNLDYQINTHAVSRLGHVPLHLSTTLTPQGMEVLLKHTKATHLYIGPGQEYLLGKLPESVRHRPVVPWQRLSDHLGCLQLSDEQVEEDAKATMCGLTAEEIENEPFVIIHSTGSTAGPKPITVMTKCWMALPCRYTLGSALTITPLSHGYAMMVAITTLACGQAAFIYSGAPYTADSLRRTIELVDGRADFFATVPFFARVLVATPEGKKALQTFKHISFCGGPTSDDLYDEFVRLGIPCNTCVAGSELAMMLDSGDWKLKDWNCVEFPKGLEKYFDMELFDEEEQSYEMIVKNGYPTLFVVNREDGLAIGDLYTKHPDLPGKWKYLKRKADTIIHSSGLKTDPLFIEDHIIASPLVKNVMAFGNDQPIVSVLIVPSEGGVTIEQLQPVIDDLNTKVPSQSRLRPGLWKILDPKDEFVTTPKGTSVRRKTTEKWQVVIDQMYKDAGDTVGSLQNGSRS